VAEHRAEDGGDEPAPSAPRRAAGRPRKEPFDARQERLLDHAVAAFAELGSGASVDLIASRAGINKALVYQHYPSKDELFAAAVRRERDRLVRHVSQTQLDAAGGDDGGPRSGRNRVRAQFHAFLDFAADHPTSLALLGRPEAGAVLDGTGQVSIAGAVADGVRRTLRRRGLPDDVVPDVLGAMFVGMAGAVIRGGAREGWDGEAVVDLLTDFTLAGLAGLDPEVLARVDRASGSGSHPGPGHPPR
jgi:AcrR family transcriptional regulator